MVVLANESRKALLVVVANALVRWVKENDRADEEEASRLKIMEVVRNFMKVKLLVGSL